MSSQEPDGAGRQAGDLDSRATIAGGDGGGPRPSPDSRGRGSSWVAWEYEDLFDAEVQPERAGFQEAAWRYEPTAIRKGRMGYRTETTVAGSRLEVRVYPIYGKGQAGAAREAKKQRSREAQERANHARSIRRAVLLAETNFGNEDFFLHLTYRGEEPDEKRCRLDMSNFLRRVRRLREKRGLPELRYLYATEGGDGKHRIHAHMLISGGIDRDELERIWQDTTSGRGGRCRADHLETEAGQIEAAVVYMAKELWAKGMKGRKAEVEDIARYMADRPGRKRRWCSSRNLQEPKTRTSDSKVSNARVQRMASGFEADAREIMEKIYPGYRFLRCGVYHSDILPGVYIRTVMYRWEHGK